MKTNIIINGLCLVGLMVQLAFSDSIAQTTQTIHLDKGSYQVEFAPTLGIPTLVSWSVSDSDLGVTKRSPSFRFKTDKDTPRPRVTSSLYTNSGFQRGHMCPAADRSIDYKSMRSTFVMTNVCPMTSALNTGRWKAWEEKARRIARDKGQCFCIAAPFFFPCDTQWIGKHRVAVPHAFFKILYSKEPPRVYGMTLIENR